ncbi:glycosyltransferase family 1 protein [Roseibium denhamense]|uniref:Mannosylfructose-phosphate synthase n=1 Tax=Roseibium denhamense TaxID=76305 RepID=A0ABY1PLR5_9HYPH|nr:glycosyltransferase [Roseibium denhamense]MTI05732.1 glycosyltransferase family 1 protein [Roseibium denhamense]SMP36957.1 mannosylfructose-phosphate synthase [Roseibium denhamense]
MLKQNIGSLLMISLHGYVAGSPELGKPDTGGQVVFVLELAKRFARLGYRVDVMTRQFEDQPAEDIINDNLRVVRIPFGGKDFIRKEDMHDWYGDFVTNALAMIRHRGLQYDVINSHYWDAGISGQKIAEELQIPHVHTPHSLGWWKEHDMEGASAEEMAGYRFEERIQKEFVLYRNCDHVIATTEQQTDLIVEQYQLPKEHISMIPPGIDEGRFMPATPAKVQAARAKHDIRETDVYVVGRAAENKGYDLIIEALPSLVKLQPEARLVLAAGANSDSDNALLDQWKQRAAELGVSDRISWRGYVADEDLADFYRAPGIFALPSRYEPFGMTAVEAMACGTPTVVTIHGGLFDQIEFGRHALVADPKRPEEFAAMLNMPLQYNWVRETLTVEGARFARRVFGWTGIARRTLQVFEQFKGRYDDLQADELVLT